MSSGGFYDAAYFEDGVASGKNSMVGAYSWDRLGDDFCRTAEYLVGCFDPKSVCDFGCAKGFLGRALCRFGVVYYGVDWSDYALTHGYEILHDFIHRHNLTRPLPRRLIPPVSCVTCFDMLEHIEDADLPVVFENMLMLRPGTIVMNICVPPQVGFDTSHVNVQPREYWLEKFRRYLPGYRLSEHNYVNPQVWWFNQERSLFVLEREYHET